MIKQIYIIATLIAICFSSCKNVLYEDAAKIVKEWTGKEIKFPKGVTCTSMGRDTTCVDLYSDNFKILLYVDSIGCTSCRLRLAEWKKIINEADTIFSKPPEFIFFFQPKQNGEKELYNVLRNNGFSHSVYIDKENEIDKLNNFPSTQIFQCFLLDKNNKVVIVGDPSVNKGIRDLFKRIITESEKE